MNRKSLIASIVWATSFLMIESAHAQPLPVAAVPARVETPPVGFAGDAADDPAIRVGDTPGRTRIIGTQKKGALFVYDLSGKVMQSFAAGRPNNVDLREGFAWADGAGPILAVSDRADNTVVLYKYDMSKDRLLETARARIASGFPEVYGVTLGRIGDTSVVVATSKTGDVAQWNLTPLAGGSVSATETRRFSLGSIAEGCAIDDAKGLVYISQELVGLWRMPVDPLRTSERILMDRVGPEGKLAADVEGVDIYDRPDGSGYVVVSVQGQSRFNVYGRGPEGAYLGSFRVTASADGKVDGVTTTDGLAVTSADLGPDYPAGLLVVQDDENTDPVATQDFKYVSFADVIAALQLR